MTNDGCFTGLTALEVRGVPLPPLPERVPRLHGAGQERPAPDARQACTRVGTSSRLRTSSCAASGRERGGGADRRGTVGGPHRPGRHDRRRPQPRARLDGRARGGRASATARGVARLRHGARAGRRQGRVAVGVAAAAAPRRRATSRSSPQWTARATPTACWSPRPTSGCAGRRPCTSTTATSTRRRRAGSRTAGVTAGSTGRDTSAAATPAATCSVEPVTILEDADRVARPASRPHPDPGVARAAQGLVLHPGGPGRLPRSRPGVAAAPAYRLRVAADRGAWAVWRCDVPPPSPAPGREGGGRSRRQSSAGRDVPPPATMRRRRRGSAPTPPGHARARRGRAGLGNIRTCATIGTCETPRLSGVMT